MAGAGWSALGAALTQGMGAYQQAAQFQLQKKAMDQQNTLMQDRINSLPRQHALESLQTLQQTQGDAMYDSPDFVRFAQAAGLNLPTKDVTQARIGQIEDGAHAGLEIPNHAQMAEQMGVSPVTGVQLPPEVQQRTSERARKGAIDQLTLQELQGGNSGWEMDPKGQIADTPANRMKGEQRKRLGLSNPVDAIYGNPLPQAQHPDNIAAATTARETAKAELAQSENQKKVTGNIASVRDLINEIKPILAARNPTDPSGQNAGIGHLLGEKAKAWGNYQAYSHGFPVEAQNEKLVQLSALVQAIGTVPFMNGSRNFQLMQKIWEHLPDPTATPEATYQRVQQLEQLLPRIEEDIRNAGKPSTQVAAAKELNPAAVPATIAPPQGAQGAQGGKAKAQAFVNWAKARGMSPAQIAAELKAAGF